VPIPVPFGPAARRGIETPESGVAKSCVGRHSTTLETEYRLTSETELARTKPEGLVYPSPGLRERSARYPG